MLSQEQEAKYAVLPLRKTVVFPYTDATLEVTRDSSMEIIRKAYEDKKKLLLLPELEGTSEDKNDNEAFARIGVLAEVTAFQDQKHTLRSVRLSAEKRYRVENLTQEDGNYYAEVAPYEDSDVDEEALAAYERMIPDELAKFAPWSGGVGLQDLLRIARSKDAEARVYRLASFIVRDPIERYDLLETRSLTERYLMLFTVMRREVRFRALDQRIEQRVNQEMEEQQKEYYLHEKIRVISEELGDYQDPNELVDDYKEKLQALQLDEKVYQRLEKEVNKLKKIPPVSPDYSVLQSYLDFVCDLPWHRYKSEDIDLEKAQKILQEDHYGLEKVKERILEFLAVEILSAHSQGSILCLVGPPGVGKTSLATSIARALNRDFVRMSLGGLEDESEIRGHRRTYVGAMPGRLLRGIQDAGSSNPVFLLDEIDKMSRNFRGDPASALLEVLDPAQNKTFSDHYLEIPYDLSKVFFITTANDLRGIPGPLLDRLEVIEIPSYTEQEKFQIAQRYLLPRQIEKHGLKDRAPFHITEGALLRMIRAYTQESGVRELERLIGRIARKVAYQLLVDHEKRFKITVQNIDRYLERPRIQHREGEEANEIGVAVGLAWTSVGGMVLLVETQVLPGNGKVQLTGSLGDVMKESAWMAMGYLRSQWSALQQEERFSQKMDVHIHIPEGAVPKEGPSAGITLATAIASAVLQKPIRKDTAMTGELTLRGRVLPVGGIREKVVAAHRAGCRRVILPKDNQRDWKDVPESVQKALEVFFVERIEEVFDLALEGGFDGTH